MEERSEHGTEEGREEKEEEEEEEEDNEGGALGVQRNARGRSGPAYNTSAVARRYREAAEAVRH
eukprot:2658845-Pyramimonas_sp.AAC.1